MWLEFRRVLCRSAEMMGKYSNLVFTDGQGKILSVLRPVDFTTSSLRQLLPGMRYELPPPQEKTNPLTVTRAEFSVLLSAAGEKNAAKWITASFLGVSAPVAREIVFRARLKPPMSKRPRRPTVRISCLNL